MVDSCKIFSSTSGALKASLVLLGVIFIVQCIGYGTDYWYYFELFGNKIHSGLWKQCSCINYFGDTCFCVSISGNTPGWLRGVAALESIGLITIIVAGFMVFAQCFCTQCVSIKIWPIILMFFSGVCILAGVTLYGVMMVHNLYFSFGLCVVAGTLCFVCAFFLIQDRKIASRGTQSAGQVYYASQGHVIQSPQTQAVISYSNQIQPPAYQPTCAYVQYGPPPAYNVIQQQDQFSQQQNQMVQQQGQFQHIQQNQK